ncbi:MAG: hypothetical protein LWX08_15725 [Deltaproteobacteria bacterium]|jgi:hypothetical protein|nr:hypothetical protein [Deltaproteobacteria bacterium]
MLDKRKTTILIFLFVFIVVTLFFYLFKKHLVWGGEVKEVSIESLYKTGVIATEKFMFDDTFYLRTSNTEASTIYLKRGQGNQPFSLDITTFKIKAASEKEWEQMPNEFIALTCQPGDFVAREGKLQNTYNGKIIEPSGTYIIDFCVSPSRKFLFLYSFSGYYRKSKGIGFLITKPTRKIGTNYFEIWNLDTDRKEFLDKKVSFAKAYRPNLLFWLGKRKLMIFSNNYYKSLIIIKY